MSTFLAGWYLIYTKPHYEKKVHKRLAELEIDSFLPTKKTLRVWRDRKKYVDEPLFPSYVFIYLNDMRSYYDGIDTEGSLYYVRTGKEIARVDEAVIRNIELVAGRAGDVELSGQRFAPGQRLVINKGALTGLSCEVIQFNNTKKLLVRIDLLQRNLLVALPTECVMAV